MKKVELVFKNCRVEMDGKIYRNVFKRDSFLVREEIECWKEKSNDSKEFYVVKSKDSLYKVLDENFEEIKFDY